MKVFIIGGTGYTGRAVIRTLLPEHQVATLVRSDEAAARLPAEVEAIRGDITNIDAIVETTRKSDVVIYSALQGLSGIRPEDKAAITAVLDTLSGTGRTFILTSGLSVYGGSNLPIADETSALTSVIPSQAWRADLEATILGATDRNIRGIVIRPAIVYGGDSASSLLSVRIAAARKSGSAFYVGDGSNVLPAIHVDDLARIYALAIHHAPAGTALNAIGSNVFGKEMADGIAIAAGLESPAVSASIDDARALVGDLAFSLTMDFKFSTLRLAKMLGWSPVGPSLSYELSRGSLSQSTK